MSKDTHTATMQKDVENTCEIFQKIEEIKEKAQEEIANIKKSEGSKIAEMLNSLLTQIPESAFEEMEVYYREDLSTYHKERNVKGIILAAFINRELGFGTAFIALHNPLGIFVFQMEQWDRNSDWEYYYYRKSKTKKTRYCRLDIVDLTNNQLIAAITKKLHSIIESS